MSKQKEIDAVQDGRSLEPWIAVLFLSLVPLLAAVILPEPWRLPLYVIGGVLCATGIALLIKQEAAN